METASEITQEKPRRGLTIHKHFDYLTPFEEADNDQELAVIATLKSSKACSNLEVDALFFARMVEGVKQYEAWRVLGLPSFENFCGVRLNKTINEVETIVAGVKALSSQGVINITERMALAAQNTTGDVFPPYRPTEEERKLRTSQRERAAESGISRRQQQHLDRLARKRPDLHDEVKANRLTVRQADIQAGFVKEGTLLDKLLRLWGKASPEERSRFLERIEKERH